MSIKRMSRDEATAWAKTLNPGDLVIRVDLYGGKTFAADILTVKKVTPTGRVRTEQGYSFYVGRFTFAGHPVEAYGPESSGAIVPYSEELGEQARIYKQEREKEMQERNLNLDAKRVCQELILERLPMSNDLAKMLIDYAAGLERSKNENYK